LVKCSFSYRNGSKRPFLLTVVVGEGVKRPFCGSVDRSKARVRCLEQSDEVDRAVRHIGRRGHAVIYVGEAWEDLPAARDRTVARQGRVRTLCVRVVDLVWIHVWASVAVVAPWRCRLLADVVDR
jgi:hypothetical protein